VEVWHASDQGSCLGFVTAATSLNGSQPNFAGCLAVYWAGTLYIHFRGLLPHYGILPGAKFTLRPSLALSYIGSITAQHSSSGHQPNFAAISRGCHLHSAGWPSRWAPAHILVGIMDHLPNSNSPTIQLTDSRNQLIDKLTYQMNEKLETVSIAKQLQIRQHVQNP